jgi:hypothetical protein
MVCLIRFIYEISFHRRAVVVFIRRGRFYFRAFSVNPSHSFLLFIVGIITPQQSQQMPAPFKNQPRESKRSSDDAGHLGSVFTVSPVARSLAAVVIED